MKRTTYILIGMLISGLIVIVVGVVFLAVTGEKHTGSTISLEGERMEMELNNVSVVKAFVKGESELQKHAIINGEMTVTTSSAVGNGEISYPKSQYLNVSQINDTLLVVLDLAKCGTLVNCKNAFLVYMRDFNVRLSVDSAFIGIDTCLDNVRLNLKNMNADSMFVNASYQEVSLDSCQFRSFDIFGDRFEFRAANSKIENYYLNLDNVIGWTFENTKVGTEYLSSSGYYSKELPKGECQRIVWNPSTKDAKLSVIFRDKAEIKVTP